MPLSQLRRQKQEDGPGIDRDSSGRDLQFRRHTVVNVYGEGLQHGDRS